MEAVESVEKFVDFSTLTTAGDDGYEGVGPLRGITIVSQSKFRMRFPRLNSAPKPEFTLEFEGNIKII